jgi:hypothetical protein
MEDPNVVLGLSTDYNLLPRTKVNVDNLFMSMDLLYHIGNQQGGGGGVTGTLRQNQIIEILLPGRKKR